MRARRRDSDASRPCPRPQPSSCADGSQAARVLISGSPCVRHASVSPGALRGRCPVQRSDWLAGLATSAEGPKRPGSVGRSWISFVSLRGLLDSSLPVSRSLTRVLLPVLEWSCTLSCRRP